MLRNREFDRMLEGFRAEVEARWRDHHSQPPSIVYHYTTALGFRGIVESRRLWCTVASELNDFRELIHASDLFKKVLRRHALAAARPDDLYPRTLLEMDYARPDMATAFVTSLSGSEDDLPQWCMYADHFYGVALGFDAAALVALDRNDALAQSVGFFAISYAENDQDAFFEWLVSRWEGEAIVAMARSLHLVPDALLFKASWFANLATAAISVLPRMKSRHFRSENEWRLAHLHVRNSECCRVHDNPGKPHVELNLEQIDAFPLKTVWLGPGVAYLFTGRERWLPEERAR